MQNGPTDPVIGGAVFVRCGCSPSRLFSIAVERRCGCPPRPPVRLVRLAIVGRHAFAIIRAKRRQRQAFPILHIADGIVGPRVPDMSRLRDVV